MTYGEQLLMGLHGKGQTVVTLGDTFIYVWDHNDSVCAEFTDMTAEEFKCAIGLSPSAT